jgi:tRNA(Ile2) C34 agmatinyltransferase TiaS
MTCWRESVLKDRVYPSSDVNFMFKCPSCGGILKTTGPNSFVCCDCGKVIENGS